MEASPSRLCGCKDIDLVQSMLTFVAQTNSYFGENQRGTDDPSLKEKETVAHETLHRSPAIFLTRYGKKLNHSHKQYFYKNFSDDDDLVYQLKLIDKELLHNDVQIKNRRFVAMKQMLADGEYFSDEQMKYRDPLLYEQMIGQYLTDEEIKDQSDALLRTHCGLSSVLLEQMDSQVSSNLYERQVDRQMSQMEESDDDDESDDDEDVTEKSSLTDDEKLALREEFLHIMQERFLSGQDTEFDYTSVDEDTRYDDLVQETRDAEERYFDEDDSEEEQNQTEKSALGPHEYDY